MALTDKLSAIADAIRGKTGGTEKLTLAEMPLAIAGIEAGGGGCGLAYDMGEFVLDADTNNLLSSNSNGVPHELGEVPDFILVWTDDFADLSEDNVSPYTTTTSIGYIWLNGLTGMVQRLTSAIGVEVAVYVAFTVASGDYRVYAANASSPSYGATVGGFLPTANAIFLAPNGNVSVIYRAGVTYKYFVSKAWWNVGGVANA